MKKAGFASGKYTGAGDPHGRRQRLAGEGDRGGRAARARVAGLQGQRDVGRAQRVLYSKFCNVVSQLKKIDVCANYGWLPDFADPYAMLNANFNGEAIVPVNNSNPSLFDNTKINTDMDKAAQIARGRAARQGVGRRSTAARRAGRRRAVVLGQAAEHPLQGRARRHRAVERRLGPLLHVAEVAARSTEDREPRRRAGLPPARPRHGPLHHRAACSGLVVLLALVSAVTFVIFYALPSADPAVLRAGRQGTPELIEQIRHSLHLDRPIYVQYFEYMKAIVLHFDFGYSYQNSADVREQIVSRLPATISLTGRRGRRLAVDRAADRDHLGDQAPLAA